MRLLRNMPDLTQLMLRRVRMYRQYIMSLGLRKHYCRSAGNEVRLE